MRATPMVQIRPATAADYPVFARLFPLLATRDPLPAEERWQSVMMPSTWMAEVDGRAQAYLHFQILEGSAYVRHLVVSESVRRQGVGRKLMQALAADLRANNISQWRLNVLPENAPAVALYEQLGMRHRYEASSMLLKWSDLHRLPPSACEVRRTPPEDDARAETSFDLPPGLLAQSRSLGRIILHGEGDPVRAVAAFDPHFPGASPFRAHHAADVSALLAVMSAHRRPEHDFLLLNVEDHRALEEMLVAAGATVRFRFAHFSGEVPS